MMNSSTNGATAETMAATEKFLFETTFDTDGQILHDASTGGPKKSYTPEEVEAIKQEAYAEGLSGLEAQMAQQNAQVLGQMSESMLQVITQLGGETTRLREQAVDLAMVVANRLCGTLLEKEPEAEIIALISRCLEALPSEPHIVVRVGEAVSEPVKTAVSTLAAEKGFNGKVLVVAEPSIQSADCRVEWADGGIERDMAALSSQIDDIVRRHLQAEDDPQGDLFDGSENWNANAEAVTAPA